MSCCIIGILDCVCVECGKTYNTKEQNERGSRCECGGLIILKMLEHLYHHV